MKDEGLSGEPVRVDRVESVNSTYLPEGTLRVVCWVEYENGKTLRTTLFLEAGTCARKILELVLMPDEEAVL